MLSSFEWCSSPPENAKIYFTYPKGFHGSFSGTRKSHFRKIRSNKYILLMELLLANAHSCSKSGYNIHYAK